jgi:hypothetical protein
MKNKIEHKPFQFYLYIYKMSQFLTNENIKLMWDIVCEEALLKQQSSETVHYTQKLFYNNLKGFYAHESRTITSLVELNKAYITMVLTALKKIVVGNRIHIEEPVPFTMDDVVVLKEDDRIDKIIADLDELKRDMKQLMELIVEQLL